MINELDAMGIVAGTDKSSLAHDYLRHYDRLLSDLRHQDITVLEIGVDQGGSLRAWESYFTRAQIVGIDVRETCRSYAGGRRAVEIGSQADPLFMDAIGSKYQPEIIIDDGSHLTDHILASFSALWRHLKPGGLYIVEDVGMHHVGLPHTAGSDAYKWSMDYFTDLAYVRTCPATKEHPAIDRSIAHMIDRIEFTQGMIAIQKRPIPSPSRIADRRQHVDRSVSSYSPGFFSEYILKNEGDPVEAASYARRAIFLQPESGLHHHQLSVALERLGLVHEAIRSEREAVVLAPKAKYMSDRLASLEAKAPDRDLGVP